MARLSLWLPPFAGDYSGVCATLFGFDCLVVIVDASCCTRNYVEYDEPRWKRRRKSTFSAQLRTMDAVMGGDERIVEQTAEAARELEPALVALVGTPVPAIVGMDLTGLAREVEDACGVPALAFPTTGFETYERGASLALTTLLKRFAQAGNAVSGDGEIARHADEGKWVADEGDEAPLSLNVLGMTPQDFESEEEMDAVLGWLEDAGVRLAFSPRATGPADVASAARADASLAVSWSGLAGARLLERRCGVPWIARRPLCAEDARELVAELCAKVTGGGREVFGIEGASVLPDESNEEPKLIIVGEQLAANAVRHRARQVFAQDGAQPHITVASFFALDKALSEPGDLALKDEAALVNLLREHPQAALAGDPLLRRIPAVSDCPFFEFPHEAVSSTLFARQFENASEANERLQETLVCFDGFAQRC